MKILLQITFLLFFTFNSIGQDYSQDWFNGKKLRYKTNGKEKSLGLNISIDYPDTWEVREGKRPHILNNIISPSSDNQAVNLVLQIKSIKDEEELRTLEQEIANPSVNSTLFSEEMTVFKASSIKIDGIEAVLHVVAWHRKNDLTSVYMKAKSCFFIYKDKFVFVQISAGGTSEEQSNQLYEKYNILFTSILNSIVVYNQWE